MEGLLHPFLHCHRQCFPCQWASHWQEHERGAALLVLLSSEVSVHGSTHGREGREEQRWLPHSDQEAVWGMRIGLSAEEHDPLTYFLLLWPGSSMRGQHKIQCRTWPADLFPSAMHHLPVFLEPLQIVPPARGQLFNVWALYGGVLGTLLI